MDTDIRRKTHGDGSRRDAENGVERKKSHN